MAAVTETRAHDSVGDRLAHQELLQRAPALVEVVDAAVVGGLEAVDAARFAADGQRRVQDLGPLAASSAGFVVEGVDQLQRIARRDPALEIEVVGEDADQLLDRGFRHLLPHHRLVEALVEPCRRLPPRRPPRDAGPGGAGPPRRAAPPRRRRRGRSSPRSPPRPIRRTAPPASRRGRRSAGRPAQSAAAPPGPRPGCRPVPGRRARRRSRGPPPRRRRCRAGARRWSRRA